MGVKKDMKKVVKSLVLAAMSAVLALGEVGAISATAFAADQSTILDETFFEEELPESEDELTEEVLSDEDLEEEESFEEELSEEELIEEEISESEEPSSEDAAFEEERAANQVGENVFYTYNQSTGELRLTGTGATYDYLTAKGDYSPFKEMKGIKTIIVEEGITELGSYIFYDTGDPHGVGGDSLKTIKLPSTLTSLHDYAMDYIHFRSDGSITIPATLTNFGKCSLAGCFGDIIVAEGTTVIRPYTFQGATICGEVKLPSTLERIEDHAFYSSGTHKDITIPKSLKYIGDYAFAFFTFDFMHFTGDIPTIGEKAFIRHEEDFYVSAYEHYKVAYYPAGNKTWEEGISDLKSRMEGVDFRVAIGNTTKKSGQCGENISYTYDNGTLTLTGYGPMYDYSDNNLPGWADFRRNLKTVKLDNRITSIGDFAFFYMSYKGGGMKINTPTSLTRVGNFSFYRASVDPFIDLSKVTYLGDYAFWACSAGSSATITLNEDITYIGAYALEGRYRTHVIVPKFNKITHIGKYAFSGCNNITGSLEFPDTLTYIGDNAFKGCKTMESKIVLPKNLTYLGEYAFAFCNLAYGDIVIPESITELKSAIFYETQITSLVIGDQVTTTKGSCVQNCSKLKSIRLNSSKKTIGTSDFKGCASLTEVDIPANVDLVYWDAFENSGVKKVTFNGDIPRGVTWESSKITSVPDIYYPKNKLSWIKLSDAKKAQKLSIERFNPNFIGYGEAAKITVTFVEYDYYKENEVIDTQVIEAGSVPKMPDVPKREGYSIQVSYYDENGRYSGYDFITPLVEDTTIYIVYVGNPIDVTFYPQNGSDPEVVQSRYGQNPYIYKTFKREGYSMQGWSQSPTVDGVLGKYAKLYDVILTSPMSFYARWVKEQLRVKYDTGCDLELEDLVIDTTKHYLHLTELAKPTREGWKFGGWYYDKALTDPASGDDDYRYEGDFTLYAKWTRMTHSVKIICDGKTIADYVVNHGDKIEKPADPVKEGYKFICWYSSGSSSFDAYDFDKPVTADIRIYANFKMVPTEADFGDVTPEIREELGIEYPEQLPYKPWIYHKPTKTYTGKAVTCPEVKVFVYTYALTPDVDYTVSYKNNVKPGTATLIIKFKGRVSGKLEDNFKILPFDLEKELAAGNLVMNSKELYFAPNGKKHKGKITLKANLSGKMKALKEGTDYEYIYPVTDDDKKVSEQDALIAPGVYTIGISGKGAFTGTIYFKEVISEEKGPDTDKEVVTPLSKMTFSGIEASLPYEDGKEIKQEIKVYSSKTGDPESLLKEGTDYRLEYQNNTGVGTATMIFTGLGKYTGIVKKTFKITAASLSGEDIVFVTRKSSSEAKDSLLSGQSAKLAVIVNEHYYYLKGGVKPAAEVYGRNARGGYDLLSSGKDYVLSYGANKVVGENTGLLKIKFKRNYKGSAEYRFTIEKGRLESVFLRAGDIKQKNATGICKPKLTVTDASGKALVNGKDYTYTVHYNQYVRLLEYDKDTKSYLNSGRYAKPGDEVDLKKDIIPAGTELYVKLYPKGNYSIYTEKGYNWTFFRVYEKSISGATFKIKDQNYSANGASPGSAGFISAKYKGKELVYGTDYTISYYKNNKSVGTATAVIRGKGVFGGFKAVTFKVLPLNLNQN